MTKLAITLLIGIMVGIEREHRGLEHEIFAGVRSYTITCIIGMLTALVSKEAGTGFVYVVTLFFGAICSIITYSKIVLYKQIEVISFSSYVLLRKYGTKRGICYSVFLGCFVNSEATTAALAGISKRAADMADPVLTGIPV